MSPSRKAANTFFDAGSALGTIPAGDDSSAQGFARSRRALKQNGAGTVALETDARLAGDDIEHLLQKQMGQHNTERKIRRHRQARRERRQALIMRSRTLQIVLDYGGLVASLLPLVPYTRDVQASIIARARRSPYSCGTASLGCTGYLVTRRHVFRSRPDVFLRKENPHNHINCGLRPAKITSCALNGTRRMQINARISIGGDYAL